MNIVVYKRRRELLEVYSTLPEELRKIILDYVREIELGNLSKAEEVIRRSVSEIFNRVYSNIKNIVSKYTLVEKCI